MSSDIEMIYELSPMQQAMLFHTLYAPGSGVYVLQMSLRLTGRLDVEAFEKSWRHLLDRHAILRTGFFWEDLDKPLQVVHRHLPLPLERLSLSQLPAVERQRRLAALLEEDRERGFDPTEPPLFRLTLAELADGVHQLLWSLHHLLVDGWSQGQLLRELFACYAAYAAGREPRLAPPGSYRNYIAWLQHQDLGEAEAFWRRTFAGFTEPSLLAGEEVQGTSPGFRAARRRDLALPARVSGALRETARRRRLTLNTLVQGAWALVLAQATGREEVVFGATASGRPADLPGVETTVGLFINTQPVRVAVPPQASLWEWLAALQESQVEKRRHEHAPLTDVQRWSGLPAGVPLFDHLLVFENVALPEERTSPVPGLEITEEASHELTNYPLSVIVLPGRELVLSLRWNAGRLETPAIVRMQERLARLLTAFAADREQPLGSLPLLSGAERHQVLVEWNDTAAPFAGPCLHELFAAQVARTPAAVAVVDGTRRLTYAELAARATVLARQLALQLRRLGAGPEARVAVCLERSAELPATLLGVLTAGAAYVPLDPAWPAERRALMLEDSGAAVLVTRGRLAADLPPTDAHRLDLDACGREAIEEEAGATALPGHLAYVIYTSGSTGRPKGVAVEHRSAVARMGWARAAFSAEELGGLLAATSVCFDLSVFEIFAPLAWGGTVILAENALELPRLAAAAEVRLLNTVPSAAAELLRSGGLPSSVRTVCLAGEALPAPLAARLYATGTVTRVLNLYGPSEDTTYSTGALVPRDATRAPAIGRPLPGTRAHVVDRAGRPVPPGVPGELWLAGAGLSRGYLGRPDLTAERFVPNPFGDRTDPSDRSDPSDLGRRAYRTGDLVRFREDGALEFLGRIDFQVKVRGFRIEPGEIEAVLCGHPDVQAAVVLARGGDRLVAWVVAPQLAGLAGWLGGKLPAYMVPSAFVRLDALPLTPNGKLDRRALPEPKVESRREPAAAPADPVEELIAGVWAEVLGIEHAGADDDFFALGGHSLLASQVISRLRAPLGVDLPLRALFEARTVARLAREVRRLRRRLVSPIAAVPRDGREMPLSFAQQRLWLIDQIEPGDPAYNVPTAVRLTGAISPALLSRIFAEIVRRHEALRTTFDLCDGRPVQVLSPAGQAELAMADLSALPAGRREAPARALLQEQAGRGFDLRRGPLLRLLLVRLGAAEHLLGLTLHHIVTDGWSMGVLLREIAALFAAFSAGRPSALPEPPVQYADFSLWQRERLDAVEIAVQVDWWKQELAGAPGEIALPLDRARGPLPRAAGELLPVTVPADLTGALRRRARALRVTPFMLLTAAFQTLLHRLSGQDDVLVGTPVAGRNRLETEGLIGFFVNTLVLRGRLGDPALTVDGLLEQTRDTTLAVFEHQDLPFERLVEELVPERNLAVPPLIQVLFALQTAPLEPLRLPGLTLEPLTVYSGKTQLDLSLSLSAVGDALAGSLELRTALFDRVTVERMAASFEHLLHALVVAAPEGRIDELLLLPASERHQVLHEWNESAPLPAGPASVLELFEHQVARAPEAPALSQEGLRLTYQELAGRARALAHHLRRRGVGPETPVAVVAERTPDLIVAFLGILQAGGAYVPVDPAYPEERRAFMLADSGGILLENDKDQKDSKDGKDERRRPEDGQLAYVLYTSGSTGRPKGVMGSHGALARYVAAVRGIYGIGPGDRVLQFCSTSFDTSLEEIVACLANGAELVLRTDAMLESAATFLEACGARGITVLSLPTAYWHEIAAQVETGAVALPACLRLVIIGGERALPARAAGWRRAVPGLPRLLNTYGVTESTIVSTATDLAAPSAAEARGELSVGRPIPGTEVLLLDREREPVPIGAAGELHLGGALLARGYLGRPDLTAERFVPHPFAAEPGARLYRTGDLARALPDGALEFAGRADRQVKIRGFRIEIEEIEAALLGHPGIAAAAVLVREDRSGEKVITAYVVPRETPGPAPADLRRFLRESLPDYMVPGAWVPLAALPLTPNGKLDRRALPAPAEAPAEADAVVPPSDPVEELLAGIWGEVLGRERIGVHDDFFTLGGHSLLATQVIARLRSVLGVELPLRQLFESATIAGLARAVRAARTEGGPPALVRVPREGDLPLSFAQQRLWLIDQLEPGSPAYNIPSAVRLTGALFPPRLAWIFAAVVHRHEALRTTFTAHDGRPVQVIAPEQAPALPAVDLSALPEAHREEEARALAAAEARRPFDLRRGPLLRLTLVRLLVEEDLAEEHLLLITMHHIVSDGWSMGVLLREIAALWRGGSPLPPLPVQYADFAVWQRSWLQGEVLEAWLAAAGRRLAGAPRVLELPTDRPRPAMQSFRGGVRLLDLSPALGAGLQALCRRAGVTPFMAFLAAWATLLGRHAGQDDVLVGSPIAGRNQRETEELIGFFVNTLVLRIGLAGTFQELLGRVRAEALDAFGHQDLPFERLVEALEPQRDLARTPLFQVLFVLQNAPAGALAVPGLTLAPVAVESGMAKFDLTLAVAEGPAGWSAALEFATDLFDAGTAERLLGRFALLLEGAVAAPETALADLPLLLPAELDQVLREHNATATAFPRDASLAALFEAVARDRPEAPAICAPGGEVWSYGRLDAAANRLARHLRSLGVGIETPVGISLERSPGLILGILAIVKAGGAYVPLDAGYPDERLAFMLEDTGAAAVLVHAATRDRLLRLAPRLVDLDGGAWEEEPAAPLGVRPPAECLAYVIYTSGSTGRPKGVAVPQRAVVRLVRETNFVHLGPDDRLGQVANSSFDAATWEIWGALLNGGAIVVIPRETLLSPAELAAALRAGRVTSMFLTSALFTRMAQEEPDAFAGMSELLVGGEAVDPGAARRVLAGRPPRRLLNGYGPTESTTFAAWHPIRAVPEGATSIPIGLPLANTTLYVLDRQQAPVPPGAVGELCIGGDGLARGYLRRPELTAERFVPDPWGEGGRLYRTGDLARRLPDNTLDCLGRIDHQVKIRGFRIEPGEIEAALAGHPDVREALVLARRDVGPAGDARLVAWVVPHGGRSPRPEELRESLRAHLPEHMIPSAVVPLPAFPLTPNGKVDRQALPDPETVRAEAATSAPADPLEELLAGIWAEVLGLGRVGAHEDFFSLGGHSLLATQVVSRIRGALGRDLALRQLFETPTVADLARVLRDAERGAPAAPLLAVPRGGDLPLSFAQQRLWLIDRIEPGSSAYHIPLALRLTGEIAPPLLERIFAEIVRRHEALRTTFAEGPAGPVQVIAAEHTPELPLLDLSSLPAADREGEARALAREAALRPFDLGRGPLLRLLLVRLGAADHLLLLTFHHVVADGWSLGVLLREIAALHAAFSQGKPSPLPPLPVQYADFAVWQRSWLQGDVLAAQIAFWKRQLAGAPAVLELPLDRPRPATRSWRGAARPLAVPPALSEAVLRLARQQGVTPFMALLAAWAVLLGRHAGQEDVLIGSPIAGRNRREIEGLIGFFVNTLVLRAGLSGDPSFGELLARVRKTALDAFTHQDLPFERIVEEVVAERHLAVSPLFQVLFALQNAPVEAMSLPGLALTPFAVASGVTSFDLTLSLGEGPAGFAGTLEHDTDLFDGTTAERLLARFTALLAAAVAQPAARLSALPLLLPAEHQQALVEPNVLRHAPPRAATIPELFAEAVAAAPEAPAVLFAGEPATLLSYAVLDRRSARWAHELRRRGAGPEVRVGLCVRRTPRMLVGLLAVLRAGAAYVPLDPAWPADRLGWMLDDAGVELVLAEEETADRLPAGTARRVLFLDGAEPAGADVPLPLPDPAQAAYVIYTSGSTGRPKGVIATHGGLAAFSQALAGVVDLRPDDRVLQFASLSFDASAVALYPPLVRGAAVVLHPDPAALTPWELVALCDAHKLTALELPAALWRLTAQEAESAGLLFGPDVRLFLTGGESLSAEALRQWGRTVAPDARLLSSYGPTETTVVATACLASVGDTFPGAPLGEALPGTGVYLLDDRLMPVPLDVPGEIFLGGAGVTRGYLGRPDLTAERFVPDPFVDPTDRSDRPDPSDSSFSSPGARLYRTGDRARRRPDGRLEFLGRVDAQVKIRGFRIEPGEIEAVLGSHPEVREAVVLARPSAAGDLRLVGWVTLAEGSAAGEGSLRLWLRERLPEHLVPPAVVVLGAFPLAATGKVDRKALPDPEHREAEAAAFAAPADPLEELLAGIWAEVLGVARIGVHDDFFALGGHSLLATQMVSRVRQALDREVPLRRVFETPTVAELARVLRDAGAEGAPAAPPLVPVARDGDLPLSFAQQRLWLVDQIEPGSAAYNVPLAVRLTGAVDPALLQSVFAEITRRHEVLRTTFAARDERPVQVIAAELSPELPVVDLAHLPAAAREAQAHLLAREEARRPFDLRRGPLLRLALVRLAEREHLLLLTVHHIVSDGWSMGVLLREIALLHEAFSQGLPSPLPPLPVQYADFAVWQRSWLQGEVLAAQIDFWKRQLAGAPAVLEMPLDRPRPPLPTWRGAARAAALSPALSEAILGLCRRQGVTPFMALWAAWATLLGRHAGQEDVLLGSPIAGRTRREVEGLIGFFVNTLVLRSDLAGNPSFTGLLGRVRRTALDAFTHQDLPFERIVEEVVEERSLAVSPLFQALFALQNLATGDLTVPGLVFSPVEVESGVVKFDLSLTLGAGPDGFAGALEHNTDLFDGTTAERLLARFTALLEGATARPEQPLAELPLFREAERHQVLIEPNAPRLAPPRAATIPELFAEAVAVAPEAPAVVFAGEPAETLSYAQLDRRSALWAQVLRRQGIGPEVRVGLCVRRSPLMLVGLLAVLRAGGAYVPLDPAWPAERLAWMLDDAGVGLVLTEEGTAERLPGGTARRLLFLDGDAPGGPHLPLPLPEPAQAAYVIYTSGSTGRPKGVIATHGGLAAFSQALAGAVDLRPDDRVLQFASLSFDASAVALYPPLVRGAAVVLHPDPAALTPWELVALCDAHRLTALELPAALWRLTAREAESAGLRFGPGVRLFMTGGESLSPEALRQWARTVTPGARLLSSYGPTETTVVATVVLASGQDDFAGAPLGEALPGTGVYLLDAHLAPVPLDVPGEIFLGGAGVTRGYLGRPDLTAERFVPDQLGARLYRTGDLARRRPDGRLEFLGRVDQQVKIRGFRIEPGEIEAVLGTHPEVREAVVLARPSAAGDLRLVGWVTLAEGSTAGEEALKLWLRERLPDHLVPPALVVLDAFPLAATGKVDRKALPDPEHRTTEAAAFAVPADPLEELLAAIWAEVLGVARVGAHDDFFALGGHSLLATQMVSRLRKELGIEVPLRRVFEAPTVARLARVLQASGPDGAPAAPPLVPVPRTGSLPLSFAQQRLWLIDQIEPESAAYNIPLALRLTGELSVPRLRHVFSEIVRRHEALRTTFALADGEPVQVIADPQVVQLPLADLTHLPDAPSAARALAEDTARRPFDLRNGPLLRLLLVRLGESEHLLLLTLHHIVADGWSLGVLQREMGLLYAGSAPLPELPVQYADFAVWQRSRLQGEVLEAQIDFWKRHLAGAPQVLDLPLDHPRPAEQTFPGATHPVAFPPGLSQALQALCSHHRVTPFMALLAAWAVLLGRHAGQDDVLLGSPIAGRNRREIEGLIGFFVNTLVLRADLTGNPSFGDLLARVRRTALDAFAHQDLPFERIVEEVVSERDLAISPLFQVLFTVQNTPPGAALDLPGLAIAPLDVDTGVAKFDLSLTLGEGSAGFAGTLERNTDLFDAATAERLLARFVALLEGAAGDPTLPLADLPLLLPAERSQLEEWNATGTAPASALGLHDLFAAQAERTPDAIALIHPTGQLTYAGLAARAGGIARHLRTLGTGPEVRVAVCLERTPDLIAALLGVLAAGGTYVPIDPAYPPERRALMLEDSGAAVLLDLAATEIPPAPLPRDASSTPGNLAYLIYTSGSTGRPKAVAIEHRSAVALIGWARGEFSADELSGVLAATSVCFDLSVFEIFVPLACGGTVILADNALALPTLPARSAVRLLNTVPSAATELVRSGGLPPSVRTVCLAGEPLPAALAARLYATGTVERVLNLYGPSEDTTYSTGALIPALPDRPPAIGRPIRGTRAHVVDRHGTPVPPGVVGELWLAGDGLARGYLGRPDLTAERFTPDSFGARVYRTGDLVRHRPNGELEFLGRIDHQVKLRGFRIELGEIETVLGSHPGVRESVVVVRKEVLVAYLTGSPDVAALRAFVASRLPDYMVPSAFVLLDAFPLSPNGKVDRKALPAPERAAGPEHLGPRDTLELELLEIWEEVLGTHPVGVRDDFFALGGHSLLAVQVTARIESRLGRHLPLAALLRHPTVERLAAHLRQDAAPQARTPLVELAPGTGRPLFLVHPVGGEVLCYVPLARLLPGPVYGLQALDEPRSVEEMAALYLRHVREVQPEGPYRLGGWSLGGAIAFEMARQLAQQGAAAERVVLIDSYAPGALWQGNLGDAALLSLFAGDLAGLLGIHGAGRPESLEQLAAWAEEAGLLPPGQGTAELRRRFTLFAGNHRALAAYAGGPCTAPLLVLRAADAPPAEPDRGWSRLAGQPADVRELPGDHYTLLREPQVAGLAAAIRG